MASVIVWYWGSSPLYHCMYLVACIYTCILAYLYTCMVWVCLLKQSPTTTIVETANQIKVTLSRKWTKWRRLRSIFVRKLSFPANFLLVILSLTYTPIADMFTSHSTAATEGGWWCVCVLGLKTMMMKINLHGSECTECDALKHSRWQWRQWLRWLLWYYDDNDNDDEDDEDVDEFAWIRVYRVRCFETFKMTMTTMITMITMILWW